MYLFYIHSCMDYCNTVLAGALRTVTDKLKWVLNTAACVVTGIWKFDRGLGQILHDQLHWLDVPDRVLFTSVWTAVHHRICQSTASRSPVLTRGSIPYLPNHVSGSTLTAVRHSQLLARWPGTHSRILSGIQRAAQAVLGVYLEHTGSRVTSASSALGVINDYALYKSMHSLTHATSLTFSCLQWYYIMSWRNFQW